MEMISPVSVNFKESSNYKDIEIKICALNDNACKTSLSLTSWPNSINDSSRKDIDKIVAFHDKID